MNRILFAGGGTAGHIEPAWATSEVWRHRHPGDEVAFLGTKSGQEVLLIPDRGGRLFIIPKVVAPRKFSLSLFAFPFQLINSVAKTLRVVKQFDVVVGFGGYVAASAYIAAVLLRKPIVIHEQNAKVGLANKFGAIFTKEICVAYSNAVNELRGAKLVGNPLKAEIVDAAEQSRSDWSISRAAAKARLGITKPLVLILGGSSGALAINKVIAEFLQDRNFTPGFSIIHSLGRDHQIPQGSDVYRPTKYIDDMATALLAADLVISRSGAIATSEIAALAKFALFIPLPIGNGEQELNAKELVNAGYAELIQQEDFTATWLAANLTRLLEKGNSPRNMAPFGTPLHAAEEIADCIERVVQ